MKKKKKQEFLNILPIFTIKVKSKKKVNMSKVTANKIKYKIINKPKQLETKR